MKGNKEQFPVTIETFRNICPNLPNLTEDKPSCFNAVVNVVKYKVTVEVVEEPVEEIHKRLEKLWLECDNIHHWKPLNEAAKKYGYTFKGQRGSQAKKQ